MEPGFLRDRDRRKNCYNSSVQITATVVWVGDRAGLTWNHYPKKSADSADSPDRDGQGL
jgi:hypothetical protein